MIKLVRLMEGRNANKVVLYEDAAKKQLQEFISVLRAWLVLHHLLTPGTSVCLPNIDSRIPHDYELRSSKKGFFRHWTPSIKKLLGELSQAESEKESKLKSILQRDAYPSLFLFQIQSSIHANKCDCAYRRVETSQELDVLISLAIASEYYEGPTSRPIILDSSSPYEVPCFSAKNLGHLVLRSDSLGKGTFVPNEIMIGGFGHASFILLIGPNMGGWESTLLRQVGADVPTDSFELSPVDRIFVQMGAKDHIMMGKRLLNQLYNILSTRCSVEECFLPTITD
nr:dna mismatch repair protein msh6 [Quercus suber]